MISTGSITLIEVMSLPSCRVVLIQKSKVLVYCLVVLFAVIVLVVATRQTEIQSKTNNDIVVPATIVQEKPVQCFAVHKVKQGETLSTIADKHKIDVDTLLAANPSIGMVIYPGDELLILPKKGILHFVEPGDSIAKLAQIYGVSADTIIANNRNLGDSMKPGEKVFIPGVRPRAVSVSRASISQRFSWPCYGELSSPYGYRWGRMHEGIDIANDFNTPIRAAAGGKVSFSGWQGGYGNAVVISHSQDCVTLYGHLAECKVQKGETIEQGQVIGLMGSTGNSTGPHVHFEIRFKGKTLNPLYLLP